MGLQNKYMGRLHINVGAHILTGVRQLRKYVVVVVVVVSFISNRIQQWNNTRKKKTLCRYP